MRSIVVRISLALAVAGAGIVLVVMVSSAHSSAPAPPAWLHDLAVNELATKCGQQAASAEFGLTNEAAAAQAYGDSSGDASRQVYLVVFHGHFTATRVPTPPWAPDPSGDAVILTVDPQTQEVVTFAMASGTVNTSAVAQMTAFTP